MKTSKDYNNEEVLKLIDLFKENISMQNFAFIEIKSYLLYVFHHVMKRTFRWMMIYDKSLETEDFESIFDIILLQSIENFNKDLSSNFRNYFISKFHNKTLDYLVEIRTMVRENIVNEETKKKKLIRKLNPNLFSVSLDKTINNPESLGPKEVIADDRNYGTDDQINIDLITKLIEHHEFSEFEKPKKVALMQLHGMKNSEIAESLGIETKKVSVIVSTFIKKLQKHIKERSA